MSAVPGPVSCQTFRRQVYHLQAGELGAAEAAACAAHLEHCGACARLAELERTLLGGLRSRLERVPAPPGLRERVRASLGEAQRRRERVGWPLPGWLVPLGAAALLALALGGFAARLGSTAGVLRVERDVVVVDLDCERLGRTLEQQRECAEPRHLNALRLAPGRYWNIGTDQPLGRQLAVDPELRAHRIRVRGELFARIATLRPTGYDDLGRVAPSAATAAADALALARWPPLAPRFDRDGRATLSVRRRRAAERDEETR